MKDESAQDTKEESDGVIFAPNDMSEILHNDVGEEVSLKTENEILIASEEIILSCRICNNEFSSECDAKEHMEVHRYLGYLNDCTIDSESIYGWLDDEYTLQRFLDDFTLNNGVSFVTRTSGRNKNKRNKNKAVKGCALARCENDNDEDNKSPDRIMFHFKSKVLPIPELPFPFTCGNYITKDCVHGRRYQSWEEKLRKKAERETLLPLEHADYARPNIQIRNRTDNRTIKKMECEATMYIKEIIIYPRYATDYQGAVKAHHIRKAKNIAVDQLKRDISMGIEIEKKSRFYVKVPLHSAHNHTTGNISNTSQHFITTDISTDIEKVQELVSEEIIGVIDDGSVLITDGTVVEDASSGDGSDVDFMSALLADTTNTVLALQQEIHAQLDRIKHVSCLCADVDVLRECLHSVTDISMKLCENTTCPSTTSN